MKVPAAKIDSFVKKPDGNVNAVLIYGPDAGLVSQRCNIICRAVIADPDDPFSTVELSYDRIKDEPALFVDELNALSFTGGRRLIKIRSESTAITKEITDALENTKSDTFAVFTADNLAPTSSLRQFFEKGKNVAALPCYNDDSASIGQLVAGKLQDSGISYNYDVIQYLSGSFAGDRMVILNEVEKLITYVGESKSVSLEDVQSCIADSSEVSMDELCNSVASRDAATTDKNLTRAFSEGVNPIPLIRTVANYFIKLQYVKSQIEQGTPEQTAISSIRPPMFFKQVPLFKKHLNMWSNDAISKMLKALTELEIECKKTGSPAELLCARTFTVLPLAVR